MEKEGGLNFGVGNFLHFDHSLVFFIGNLRLYGGVITKDRGIRREEGRTSAMKQ